MPENVLDWKFEEGCIHATFTNGEMAAETTYSRKENGEVDINHTYVAPSLRGKGIAGDMMAIVAEHLRGKRLKATASCSFANAWLRRNREMYQDVISTDLDNQGISCRIDKTR